MGEDLKFKRIDDNTIEYSFVERVDRIGNMNQEEFQVKYNTLISERELLEKEMQALNVKRLEYDEQLTAYEAFIDEEKPVEENYVTEEETQ